MGFAENVKRRRLELNLSQQELADAMGYRSRSTIAKIEAGENNVPESKIDRFAQALYTTSEYLMTGQEAQKSAVLMDGYDMDAPHKNVVIVLAGGKSSRNMNNIPNQFVNVLGKPVIMYCLEAFQQHPAIDDIYVVCLKEWKKILEAYIKQYGISKLRKILPAGDTGIQSIRNGVDYISTHYNDNDVVIFQESTRPLVSVEMISKLLNACRQKGSAVTCEPMNEYVQFQLSDDNIERNLHSRLLSRNRIVSAQSPEAYRLGAVKKAFEQADKKNLNNETCFAMMLYNLGFELQFYEGNHHNIKIVRPEDIAILSALLKNQI